MDAFFDNNANVLNARIRISRDNSAIYSLKTTFGLRGRKITVLRDENPALGAPDIAGHIYWKEKVFEVCGVQKKLSEIRRVEGGFLKKTNHWRWGSERKEFELKHNSEGWRAIFNDDTSTAAEFSVPFRPHLFTKPEPSTLHLTQMALEEDEVFLILVFIYSEVKRQDKTNSSSSNGGLGW